MHCWKTINIEYEYGTTRLILLASIMFILVFCFAYIAMSFNFIARHEDKFLWVLLLVMPFVYPVHKLLHYMSLVNYRKSLDIRFKIRYIFIPIIHMRLQQGIPKKRYIYYITNTFFCVKQRIDCRWVIYTRICPLF